MPHESGMTTKPRSHRPGALIARVSAALVVAAFTLFAASAPAYAVTKLSQSQAASQFNAAGITWSSSGNCTTRSISTCTSFEQINQMTVSGGVTLRNSSACSVNITGGTEVGHANGTYSHYNGYKIDISKYTCIGSYITNTFTRIANRSDGAPQWQAASGNIYADEGNHWDITYYSCGCSTAAVAGSFAG